MEADQLFIKGFNHGFIFAKENIKLYDMHFKSIQGVPDYKLGFEKGKVAFLEMEVKEKAKKKNKGRGGLSM